MPDKIQHPSTTVSGRQPTTLEHGEIAINRADKSLMYKDASNNIQELSSSGGNSYTRIQGNTTVDSGSSNQYTINNYNAFSSYSVSVTDGSVSRSGDTITFNAATYSSQTNVTLTVNDSGNSSQFTIVVKGVEILPPEPPPGSIESGDTNIPEEPVFNGGEFVTSPPGSDTHKNTDWVLKDSNGNIIWSSMADSTNLTSIQIPAGILDPNKNYTLEYRYRGHNLGAGNWVIISFRTATIFPHYGYAKISENSDSAIHRNSSSFYIGTSDDLYRLNVDMTIESLYTYNNIPTETRLFRRIYPHSPYNDIVLGQFNNNPFYASVNFDTGIFEHAHVFNRSGSTCRDAVEFGSKMVVVLDPDNYGGNTTEYIYLAYIDTDGNVLHDIHRFYPSPRPDHINAEKVIKLTSTTGVLFFNYSNSSHSTVTGTVEFDISSGSFILSNMIIYETNRIDPDPGMDDAYRRKNLYETHEDVIEFNNHFYRAVPVSSTSTGVQSNLCIIEKYDSNFQLVKSIYYNNNNDSRSTTQVKLRLHNNQLYLFANLVLYGFSINMIDENLNITKSLELLAEVGRPGNMSLEIVSMYDNHFIIMDYSDTILLDSSLNYDNGFFTDSTDFEIINRSNSYYDKADITSFYSIDTDHVLSSTDQSITMSEVDLNDLTPTSVTADPPLLKYKV